jgi:protein dithiol oxidoreductase (disulfide-forming)
MALALKLRSCACSDKDGPTFVFSTPLPELGTLSALRASGALLDNRHQYPFGEVAMFRRDLIKTASSITVASAVASAPLSAWAQRSYQEGQDFVALDKRVPSDAAAGRVEVIEFFWYSCPHCNAFEPRLEQWIAKLPKEVTLRRMPVAFRDDFVPQQRLFYALEAMGKVKELHQKVFYAIHVEKRALNTQASIVDWVGSQGIDKAQFEQIYNSFAVQTKGTRAKKLQDDYKVSGVPALGIAGRFYTDGALAQSMERALQVTDFLIAEIKKGR